MYTPPYFKITELEEIQSFIEQNGFAILVSAQGGCIQETHTPCFLDDHNESLFGHLARANSQWKTWSENEAVKVIFHGPHTYISPQYYKAGFHVPTWNYTAVSVSGTIEILNSNQEKLQVIQSLVERNESRFENPWEFSSDDERVIELLAGIVCFKIKIMNTEAKFKLNQNKSQEDRLSVVSRLMKSEIPSDQQIGALMEKAMKKKS